jgi:PEP-CTERM motif
MIGISKTIIGALIFTLTCGVGVAMADTLTLSGGGTVNGSFIYDATTNSVVSFNFTTTAAGGFGNEVYNNTNIGSGAVVLTNQNGDQVFGFDALQASGTEVDELDIVLSCGGVVNCATQASLAPPGTSFAITAGFPPCGTGAGFCIASGLQNSVPGGLQPEDLLSAGNFVTLVDPPPCITGHVCFTATLSTAATGAVFNGGGTGTGTPVPEPSTLLLLASGIGVLFIFKPRSA